VQQLLVQVRITQREAERVVADEPEGSASRVAARIAVRRLRALADELAALSTSQSDTEGHAAGAKRPAKRLGAGRGEAPVPPSVLVVGGDQGA
jgi:hypothetical protein